jgi:hypothetical protein
VTLLTSALRPRRRQNTLARAARYLGLSAWFGGGLMGLTAIDRAAATIDERAARAVFVAEVRTHWTRAELVALAAHLAGSAALGWAGRHRGVAQQGMPTAMMVDTAATAAAVAAKAAGLKILEPALASVSVVAQGYLADQQRPGTSLRRLRGLPADRQWVRASALARAVQDLGVAACFGGALRGVITLDRHGTDSAGSARVAQTAWERWVPVGAVAMGAHLVGQFGVLRANARRIGVQRGLGAAAAVKAAAGIGAMAATLLARGDAARVRRARTAIVLLSGADLVIDAKVAELQRPLTAIAGVISSRRRT